jgi:eukaryotic-like serine/threonine-protein kinase
MSGGLFDRLKAMLSSGSTRLPRVDREERLEERDEIGEGGMGVVYEAQDKLLDRTVAVKLLQPGLALIPEVRQRFIEEARITSQLDHPSIVPLYDLAADREGNPYFIMKLVKGVTLERFLDHPERSLGSEARLQDALEMFMKVCDAVAFAHSRGVLHLDIKPQNVMVGEFGEVYLMDWGLSPAARSAVSEKSGERLIIGTAGYMSPEQASAGVLDHRTDIFGLGALLYYIVSGAAPYDPEDGRGRDLRDRACRCDYTPPQEVGFGALVPDGLAKIISKAMCPREQRYSSVAEVKTQVQRFFRGGLHLAQQTFPPGARIVEEGGEADEAYIITRGRCAVYKGTGPERRLLCHLEAGAVFGEIAVIAGQPRSATVEAVDEVTTVVLTRERLADWLSGGRWEAILVRSLVDRFRALDAELWARD